MKRISADFWIWVIGIAFVFAMAFVLPAFAGDAAIGDSLALGTGRALGVPTYAVERKSSCWILGHLPRSGFDHAVISAGTNDPPGRCIAAIRARIHARHVVWILPVNGARAPVAALAHLYGDPVVAYRPGRDGIHPPAYAPLARAVLAAWR